MTLNIGDGKSIYCYLSYISCDNIIIASQRPLATKFSTNYSTEETQLIKLKNDSEKMHIKTKQIIFKYNTISHNFTVIKCNNYYVGIGGVSMTNDNNFIHTRFGLYKQGLYLLISRDCINWIEPKLIIPRTLSLPNECCCFDSQPCFFYNVDKYYYLYIRWNSSKGRRKLQLFKTNNIKDWTNTKPIEVKINVDINIYVAYIFKEKDIFYGIVNYYYYSSSVLNAKILYNNIRCGLIQSKDGINFNLKESNIVNYKDFGWIIMNSLHIRAGKKYIYFCSEEGKISRQELII